MTEVLMKGLRGVLHWAERGISWGDQEVTRSRGEVWLSLEELDEDLLRECM